MSFLFPKTKMSAPPPIPPVPPPPAIDVPSSEVEDDLRADLKRRKGTSASIVTSGMGLTTEEKVAGASLLGGAMKGS